MTGSPFCVCAPARNEATRLPRLLEALAAQTVAGSIRLVICINNSDDGSVDTVAAEAARYAGRLAIGIEERQFPNALAHAGSARACAMDAAYDWLGGEGVLISTDADCRPPANWIEANLAVIEAGADIVGGRIVIDDLDVVPPDVAAACARLDRYWAEVRAIEDAIDPPAWEGPSRHGDHTGASLAIDAALFRAAGGVPPIASGEDRALVRAAMAAGGRLVHPMAVWTRVSPRTRGRAAGGMAAAMADLQETLESGVQPLVPAFDQWRQRAEWRRDRRAAECPIGAMLELEDALPPMANDMVLPEIDR